MRFAVCLLLCAAFAFPARAQDDPCERYPNIPVNITPRFDEPTYDYSLDLAQLQAFVRSHGGFVHGAHQGLTLGLTHYSPMIEMHVPVEIATMDGLSCAHVKQADVTFGYQDVTVYIPREVPQDSCGFKEVMAHEQKHIAVNKRILDKYVPIVKERFEAYLKINGTMREENPDYASSLLKEKLGAIMTEVSNQMNEENQGEQRLVDSPAEYRRVSAACNGQLAQTTNQYYRTGR